MSMRRLYLTLARSACSSWSEYNTTTPGVASGTLIARNLGDGVRSIHSLSSKRYVDRPASLMTHSFPSRAVARIRSGSAVRYLKLYMMSPRFFGRAMDSLLAAFSSSSRENSMDDAPSEYVARNTSSITRSYRFPLTSTHPSPGHRSTTTSSLSHSLVAVAIRVRNRSLDST